MHSLSHMTPILGSLDNYKDFSGSNRIKLGDFIHQVMNIFCSPLLFLETQETLQKFESIVQNATQL